MEERLTITDVAKFLGVTPRTIMRWEKSGKIRRSKRDWRGWRFYHKDDLESIKKFFESTYEYNGAEKTLSELSKLTAAISIFVAFGLASSFLASPSAWAASEPVQTENIVLEALPVVDTAPATVSEAVKYTLGPDDALDIEVRRHPEFSGQYVITSEGKIEYKFVGDIIVVGLTKYQLKERLTAILSEYIIDPEIDVRITAYLSKVFYVVGEVNKPGKFYMKGNSITIREALVQAGLPTLGAAMRRCRLITPDNLGKDNYDDVNVYDLLYGGDLRQNVDMKPGDVLYVPSTVMAKIIHVISPATNAARETAGAAGTAAALAAMAI